MGLAGVTRFIFVSSFSKRERRRKKKKKSSLKLSQPTLPEQGSFKIITNVPPAK